MPTQGEVRPLPLNRLLLSLFALGLAACALVGAAAAAPTTLFSFDGIGMSGAWGLANTNGDIGRSQYVQAAGGRLAVYSRVGIGTPIAALSTADFWSPLAGKGADEDLCVGNPSGDATVVHDDRADRWVVAESAGPTGGPYAICVAVSKTEDATGEFNRYAFQVSTTKRPAAPKVGVWQDAY